MSDKSECSIQVGGLAFVFRAAFLQERRDAFPVVGALIHFLPVGVDFLKAFGGNDGRRAAQNPELPLDCRHADNGIPA